MNWNLVTIIRPELLPVFIGGIYLLTLIPLKQISFSKIVLSLLVLMTLAPLDTVGYSFILGAAYIALAFIFMNAGQKGTAHKYFILSFVAMAVNLDPLMPHYKFFFLVMALAYAFLLSEKNDIRNTYIYISNMTILAGLVLRISDVPNKELAAAAVIIFLMLASLKMIFGRTSTLLFIMPMFLIGAVLSDKLIFVAILIYTLYSSIFANTQKHKLALTIIFMLPFLDGSIFNHLFLDVMNKDSLFNPSYISWIMTVLISICAAKVLEVELKKRPLKFNYKTALIIFVPILLVAIRTIETGEFIVALPVPLLASIPLIILEARYLCVLNRISLDPSFKVIKPLLHLVKWVNITPRTIKFTKTRSKTTSLINSLDSRLRSEDYTILLGIALLMAVALILYYGALL
jgi:hypothetical protein